MSVIYGILVTTYVVLAMLITESASERILCVFQTKQPSHHQTLKAISRALSLRGHQVTAVTAIPHNDPTLVNLTEVDISSLPFEKILWAKSDNPKSILDKQLPIYERIQNVMNIFDELGETILNHQPFKEIYTNESEKFDLIILQTYLNPLLYALSVKLNAPLVVVSSMGLWSGSHVAAGNPNPPAIYSEMYLPFNGDLNFYERIQSTLYFLWTRYYIYFFAMPKSDQIARKYFGSNIPYLADIEKNTSAWFLSINPIFYTPRPMVPTMVPISFIHIQPAKPLPQDLKKAVESAKNGVVYFSMGSSVPGTSVPQRVTDVYLKAFAELPYTILWKYEKETIEVPGNVIVRKWFPQQDVLAHPNVKVFVTQCGLQSFEEAVDREVPMVCIPFISEQELNSRKLAELGYIKQIEHLTITKEELVDAIVEVAENSSYKQYTKHLRQLLQDEPMTAADKVIWWSEYVMRHKGTKHLRSPTVDIGWCQYFLLDVFAVILGVPIVLLIFLFKLIHMCFKTDQKKMDKKKKQ